MPGLRPPGRAFSRFSFLSVDGASTKSEDVYVVSEAGSPTQSTRPFDQALQSVQSMRTGFRDWPPGKGARKSEASSDGAPGNGGGYYHRM